VVSDPRKPFAVRILGAVVVATLAMGAASGAPSPDPSLPLILTDPVDERPVELNPGAPVLHLVFFATWCPPCRDELPRLAELVTRWGDRGYRLVVIAVPTRQTAERLREFLGTGGVEGEFLFDAKGAAQNKFRTTQLPSHVILDGGGKIVLQAPGLDDEVESTIERMMLEHAREAGE
jgi:thiol-disulfide isomerase/thioredoxin